MKRMTEIAKEAGIGGASEEMHLRAKIFEALSKEQRANLITMMPDASLADIMAKLDAIELWDKIS